jgi:serine/threonine-protein kinase
MPDATTLTPAQESLLDEVLAGYLSAARTGSAPDRPALLARYPELAGPLAEFFADQDRLTRLAAPLRALRPAPALPAGAVVGDYELLGEVARGGMGVVYRARHRQLNRMVALKMLRAGGRADAEELRRFRAEAEAAARLDHPNIVPIFEVGDWHGQPFFSMKLVEGGHLGTHVAALLEAPATTARLLAQVARAVHYAHQRGVLHRDLKPSNILLAACGFAGNPAKPQAAFDPIVSDFGLAKLLAPDGSTPDGQWTQTGTALGTPSYMAPEQAAGGPSSATTAADVYALGAIMYELLTGRPPFRAETPLATLRLAAEREPDRPRQLRPGVPRDLETVALKCLEKDPARRYASAAALADDLERWLRGEPIAARPVGALGAAWRWARRQPVLAGLSAALVASVVAGLAVSLALWRQARAAADRAEAHAAAAEAGWRESDRQRDRAEANFRLAHRAVNDFCTRFNEKRFVDDAARQGFGRDLLDTALKYHREFLAVRGDDPALLEEFADTHFRLAALAALTGSRAEALAAFEQARGIYEGLIGRHPDRPALHSAHAWTLNRIGLVRRDLGRVGDALTAYRQARAELEELAAGRPDDPELLYRLSVVCGHEGNALRAQGDRAAADACYRRQGELAERMVGRHPDRHAARAALAFSLHSRAVTADRAEALDLRRRAVAIDEELVAERPDDRDRLIEAAHGYRDLSGDQAAAGRPDDALASARRAVELLRDLAKDQPRATNVQTELGFCYRQVGVVHREAGRNREALDAAQEALRIDARLVEDHPDLPGPKNCLAKDHFDIAFLLKRNGQTADAARAYERSRELRRRVVELDPEQVGYRVELAMTCHNLGLALWELGRSEEAAAVTREAAELRAEAFRQVPTNDEYRRGALRDYRLLADFARDLGRTAEAAEALGSFAALAAGRPGELYDAAHDLARTARAAGAGKPALSDADRAQRERLGGLALGALAEAVRVGFRDAARLHSDPAFAALRDREEYRRLLAELSR